MNPKTLTCKFYVTSIIKNEQTGTEEVTLTASYDDTIPEDRQFSDATPWGEMKFGISNPAAKGVLKEGQAVYLHVVPVKDGT